MRQQILLSIVKNFAQRIERAVTLNKLTIPKSESAYVIIQSAKSQKK